MTLLSILSIIIIVMLFITDMNLGYKLLTINETLNEIKKAIDKEEQN